MKLAEYFDSKTDKELRAELRGLNHAIDKVECFGVNDLHLRDAIEKELMRRKIEGQLEKLNDTLAEVFPSRHYARTTVFLKLQGLEQAIKENF